ncbi:hypothetical protein BL05057 [Bacillus licheniformis DSM 13 = ATCC 14580]|uniref:Uncharacterized protein n=1 Tax=Bacillus licheniformis (strain ATCC 14580 / DSM 13 / JCM 2505 / CCUG 7422 / NBRC 12200 / NCIMB 9375 / NCTC 10341 / NRRL NRS-1264 / Gibson 46) TaxID=279010 RepID=Q62YB8_BACLD|nr:hypothetical protein BL05057 [Bacillus licheniformis DSM 13 = ATCC 14580]TWK01953.1 hypothetical protein CHCC20487_2707 [Bacillus licheniformis]TWN04993.1 hypothetical protein CHCC14566_4558 [Bacillus licheniformis]
MSRVPAKKKQHLLSLTAERFKKTAVFQICMSTDIYGNNSAFWYNKGWQQFGSI